MPEKSASSDYPISKEVDIGLYIYDMALDLKLLLAFIFITLIFIYVPILNTTFIRSGFGIVMLLFIPGYALIAALFPGESDLGKAERAALSIGLSIALSSLIGLGLNYTPWGIRLDPLAICLSLFSIICMVIANRRRHALDEGERYSVSMKSAVENFKNESFPASDSRFERMLNFAIIALVLVSIIMTILILAVPKQGEKFTEFYILGPTGLTEDYPMQFFLGETRPITIGIVNHEYRNVSYDFVLNLGDGLNTESLYSGHVTLANEQSWERSVNLKPGLVGTGMRMDFLLYKDGKMTDYYRECHLWVNVTEPI